MFSNGRSAKCVSSMSLEIMLSGYWFLLQHAVIRFISFVFAFVACCLLLIRCLFMFDGICYLSWACISASLCLIVCVCIRLHLLILAVALYVLCWFLFVSLVVMYVFLGMCRCFQA